MPDTYAWGILLAPLVAFALIVIIGWFFEKQIGPVSRQISAGLAIAGVAISFVLSLWAFGTVWNAGHEPHILRSGWDWLRVLGPHGEDAVLRLGIRVDPLTTLMLILASVVSLLVQIYSLGYMAGERGFTRFYAFLSLFTFSMISLVLADNLLMLFMSWELVGLCSYLLIGHWYDRPAPAAAQLKAFLTTRVGDVGFLFGLMVLWWASGAGRFAGGTFDIEELIRLASPEVHGLAGGDLTLTVAMILLFTGAIGKSAQWPLHTWLPDAMEGPTPVSALIHAATMVAAGVYLVARMFPIFEHSEVAMLTVAIIGGFTAIFAASMGLVMNDIKRVLAYSTISQLGYMFLGLGAFGLVAGVFHLFTHGYFKALLFLGSGSVIHGAGTQDMREMGGLRRFMPITTWTFVVGSLALAGIIPFSGFWSKDEVLADALRAGLERGNPVYLILFLLALAAAFMTAFYIFRAVFLTFFGTYRGVPAPHPGDEAADAAAHGAHNVQETAHAGAAHAAPAHGGHGHGLPHESPAVMTIPLVILAIPATFIGLINVTGALTHYLEPEGHFEMNLLVAGTSTVVAVLGIVLAWAMYSANVISPVTVGRIFRPLYILLSRKYFVDEVYGFGVRFGVLFLAEVVAFFDRYVIDGIVNGIAWLARATGGALRHAQTGRAQFYGLTVFLGAVILFAIFLWAELLNVDLTRLVLR